MDIIHEKAPRETVGRDTMVRFRMQFQAAAFAALEILSGKEPNVQYIGDTLEAFSIAAHNAIWKHSEIELHQHEIEQIAKSLVMLVEEKSCAPIGGLAKANIDLATGVGLEDLLKVLSISTQVYQTLLQGGDPAAIKSASILQRKLKEVGTPDHMIESASRAKVSWDVWMRNARHTFPEFTLDRLLEEVDKKCKAWLLAGGELADLEICISELMESPVGKQFPTLGVDLLFGALCAAIVRKATQ